MQSIYSQDQSTQAMTEVALALSMAFFSLLLLALISIGVPESSEDKNHKASANASIKVPEFVLSESTQASTSTEAQSSTEPLEIQYVFYFNAAFYDQYVKQMQITSLDSKRKVVLAMPRDTDVTQALALQQQFQGFDLSLTIMDQDWLLAFESAIDD